MDQLNKEIKSLLLLYLSLTSFSYVYSQAIENPTDLTRTDGEPNVRIPCELALSSGGNRMIFWRINDVDYTINNLPSIYTQTLSGLRINTVTLAMNGTSFQCLLPTDNDLAIRASSIGVLTVVPNEEGNTNPIVPEMKYLEIDHQNLNFGSNSVTLSWKLNALNVTCNVISIISTDPRETSASQGYNTSSDITNVTLPVDFFYTDVGEPSLINISLVDDLQRVCSGLTVSQKVKFNIDRIESIQVPLESNDCNSYCIDITPSSFILAVPNSLRDMYCPVYIESGKDCYNYNRCSGFNESFPPPFFSICRSSFNRSSFQMCFRNINEAQDGMKLFFIIANHPNNLVTLSSNLYIRAIEIHVKVCPDGPIQEPSLFNVTEGHSGYLIPCTACESEMRTAFWRINGSDFFNFDNQSFYFSRPNGLLVGEVFRSMNGTTIQCVLPAQDGLPMLIGCEKNVYIYYEFQLEEEFFQLDHQNLSFHSNNVTLVWRGYYDENCSSSYIQVQSTPMCNNNNYSVNSTNGSSLTLPLYAPTREKLKFYLSVQYYGDQQCPNSMSQEERVTFDFDRMETVSIPFGYSECSCIYIRNTITLIISSNPKDIRLGVQLNDGHCYNFTQFNEYSYAFNATRPFLSLCKESTNVKLRMCFGNLTEELNGIKLYSTINMPCSGSIIRKYLTGIVLQIQANVVLNNSNKICIIPPANSSTCRSNPVNDVFSVLVTDISGYSVFNGSVAVDTCENMNTLQQPYCAPYEITIGVMESFLQVPQGEYSESNLCRCMEENINTTFKAMVTRSGKLRVQYTCNTLYISIPDVAFELSVQYVTVTIAHAWRGCKADDVFEIENHTISCQNNANLSLSVSTNLGRDCFMNQTVTVMCPEPPIPWWVIVIIALLVVIVCTVVVLVIIIIGIYRCCCGEKNDHDQDNVEMESTPLPDTPPAALPDAPPDR